MSFSDILTNNLITSRFKDTFQPAELRFSSAAVKEFGMWRQSKKIV